MSDGRTTFYLWYNLKWNRNELKHVRSRVKAEKLFITPNKISSKRWRSCELPVVLNKFTKSSSVVLHSSWIFNDEEEEDEEKEEKEKFRSDFAMSGKESLLIYSWWEEPYFGK